MKVLLIQADGSYPNLVLMKLSAYYKSLGDEVFLERGLNGNHQLLCTDPDLVAISCIFSWNKTAALELAGKFESEVKNGKQLYVVIGVAHSGNGMTQREAEKET